MPADQCEQCDPRCLACLYAKYRNKDYLVVTEDGHILCPAHAEEAKRNDFSY